MQTRLSANQSARTILDIVVFIVVHKGKNHK